MAQPAPQTLDIHVPFVLKLRGGRKEIILPPGAAPLLPRIDTTTLKALARAFGWQRMLDSGQFATVGDLAVHEKIAPSYMTRVMRLTLLAPEIVEGIVAGHLALELAMLLVPFPVEWESQATLNIEV